MDNDANVGAMGEAEFGAGKGYSPLFYMTLSTGIGGGIWEAGRIWRGADSGRDHSLGAAGADSGFDDSGGGKGAIQRGVGEGRVRGRNPFLKLPYGAGRPI